MFKNKSIMEIASTSQSFINFYNLVVIKEMIIVYITYIAEMLNFQFVLKVGQISRVAV